MIVEKDFAISYAHRLHKMPHGHPCGNLHGHNAVVSIKIEMYELDEYDFVIDFGELSFVQEYLNENFDHKTIVAYSDIELGGALVNLSVKQYTMPIEYQQTTSENLCMIIYEYVALNLPKNLKGSVLTVTFSETPKSRAAYTKVVQ